MRIIIIEARFYNDIADNLLNGAVSELQPRGIDYKCLTVPGIFEIPSAIGFVLDGDINYDGYIVLGCAIRGETDHYDHVCREAMAGVREFAQRYRLALGNGILTVRNMRQGVARSLLDKKNFGGQAARACLRMIEVKKEFEGI